MINLLKKSTTHIAAAALMCAVSTSASADMASDINKIKNQIEDYIKKNVGTDAMSSSLQSLYTAAMTRNMQIQPVIDAQKTKTAEQDLAAISFSLGPTEMDGVAKKAVRSMVGGDSFIPGVGFSVFAPGAQNAITQELMCGNSNFSFESLISPAIYAKVKLPHCGNKKRDQNAFAQGYILNAGNFGTPVNSFTAAKALSEKMVENAAQATELANSDEYKDFQIERRNLVALRSAAISNLQFLYAQRLGDVKDNGDVKTPSQMYLFNKMASSRIGNAVWYTEMLKAYPAQLAREQVMILAEMQQELHQMNVVLQRQLGLNSASTLAILNAGSTMLDLKMRKIENKISEIKQKAAEEAGTASQESIDDQQKLEDLKESFPE